MADPNQEELQRQLAALRRELRLLRVSLSFLGLMVGLLFLQSVWGMALLGLAARFGDELGLLAGMGLVIILAAVFASRYLPKRPEVVDSYSQSLPRCD